MREIKLLYTDDEEDIREIVEFALEDEGFILELCASGQEALETLETFKPDMILLDVMMPGLDGPGTLQALRKLPGFEKTPVIFCTAKALPDEVEQLISLGATDVISKPFNAMELPERIRAIWTDRHA